MGCRFNAASSCFWACPVYGVGDAMNEQIKELAEQAGLLPMWVCVNEPTGSQIIKPIDKQIIERFAELVRQDERKRMTQEYNPYEIGKRLQKDGYGISDIGIRVKCDADIEQALQGYCDQMELTK